MRFRKFDEGRVEPSVFIAMPLYKIKLACDCQVFNKNPDQLSGCQFFNHRSRRKKAQTIVRKKKVL